VNKKLLLRNKVSLTGERKGELFRRKGRGIMTDSRPVETPPVKMAGRERERG
jgi:hypothetical protein